LAHDAHKQSKHSQHAPSWSRNFQFTIFNFQAYSAEVTLATKAG
jgi:hypothetical protein